MCSLTKWPPVTLKVGQGHPKTIGDHLGCTSIGVSDFKILRESVLQILSGNERRAAAAEPAAETDTGAKP